MIGLRFRLLLKSPNIGNLNEQYTPDFSSFLFHVSSMPVLMVLNLATSPIKREVRSI